MLVNTGNKVFVSVGTSAPAKEKAAAMLKAQAFIATKGLPMQTQICRVMAGQALSDPVWLACGV